jgi:outer membrane protein assembly factor BamB
MRVHRFASMSWRIRSLIVAPVILFVFGALLLSCGGGSSGGPTSSVAVELSQLIIYQGSPVPPTPTPSSTKKSPSPTPSATMTARPVATSTQISVSETAQYGVQGLFFKANHPADITVQDLTASSGTVFTSQNPSVLQPPQAPSSTPGLYLAIAPGCSCIAASNSNKVTTPVGVTVAPVGSPCPVCPTQAPTATATPKSAAKASAENLEPAAQPSSAGVVTFMFTVGAQVSGRIVPDSNGAIDFISSDGFLYSVDSTGTEIFRHTASGLAPAVTANGLIIALDGANLDAFKSDGTLAWQTPVSSTVGPIAASDAIYVETATGIASISSSGHLNWSIDSGSIAAGAPLSSGLVVAAPHGALTAYAGDGAASWTFTPAGGFSGALAVQNDVVYAGSGSGTIYALDASTGAQSWHVALPGPTAAGPTVGDSGMVYVSAGSVYAISSDGQTLWQQSGLPPSAGALVAVGDADVFDAASSDLAVMLGAEGAYAWSTRSFGPITTAASGGGIVYVATQSGRIFALR